MSDGEVAAGRRRLGPYRRAKALAWLVTLALASDESLDAAATAALHAFAASISS